MFNLASNEAFVDAFRREIHSEVVGKKDPRNLPFIFYALYPVNTKHSAGRRPLTINIKNSTKKSMELLLDMLTLDDK